MLTTCGITSRQAWDDHVAQVRATRAAAGQPLSRWSAAHLLAALDLAVRGRGWPASRAGGALLRMAADPATRSPAWPRSRPSSTPPAGSESSCNAPPANSSPPSAGR